MLMKVSMLRILWEILESVRLSTLIHILWNGSVDVFVEISKLDSLVYVFIDFDLTFVFLLWND